MSADQIAAASQVHFDEFNSQHQTRITWDPSLAVVGAHYDQAVRNDDVSTKLAHKIAKDATQAKKQAAKSNNEAAAGSLEKAAGRIGEDTALSQALLDLAASLRG
jgi:hypothetical protein